MGIRRLLLVRCLRVWLGCRRAVKGRWLCYLGRVMWLRVLLLRLGWFVMCLVAFEMGVNVRLTIASPDAPTAC